MKAIGFALGALALALLAGCSGASYPSAAPVPVVTRDLEPTLSADALILASRAATTPWVPLELARRIDRELSAIRSRFSAVRAIHARDGFEPRALLVAVKDGSPWVGRWLTGQLATGQPALDRTLSEHQAAAVQILHRAPNRTTVFKVSFTPRLNLVALAPQVAAADPFVAWAETNHLIGDGDDIDFQSLTPGSRYDFSRGWGDCTAGCIHRRHYRVVFGEGTLQIVESGDSLP